MHAPEVAKQTAAAGQALAPHVTWVEVGGTVTWHAESGSNDTVARHADNPGRIPADATPCASDLLAEGEPFEHTVEEPGVYDYYWRPHEAVCLAGTVIAGEPDAHDQPGLEDSRASLPDGVREERATLGRMVMEALGDTH